MAKRFASDEDDDRDSLMERIRRKQKQIEANLGSWWKPAEGRNVVRIMPSWLGPKGEWYKEIINHYEVGPDRKSCPCLKQYDSECPVCDIIGELCNSRKAADQTTASKMMARSIYAVNVGVPNDPDGIVKPWRMGEKFFHDVLGLYTDGDLGDFSHPKRGYDLIFTRTGTNMQTRYGSVRPGKKGPLLIEDWKSRLKNLDAFVKPYTRKEMRQFLAGEDD